MHVTATARIFRGGIPKVIVASLFNEPKAPKQTKSPTAVRCRHRKKKKTKTTKKRKQQ